ncbi:reverse transcriptase domain-containing protein [Tanacetum coccineum]
MSTHEQQTSTIPTSVVRNTGGKSGPQNLEEPASNEALRELCDKNYHQLLPLIAEKMQKEKEQQDKLKAVKARLLYGNESGRNPRNHEESHYSESKTPTARTEPRRRHGRKHSRSPSPVASVFRRLKQNRPPSPRLRPRKEGGVFNRLGRKEPGASTRSDSHHQSSQAKGTEVPARKHHHEGTSSRRTSGYSESEDSEGGHWKSKSKRHRTRMPSHVKTYDGSGDPEDHIKLFQSAAKTERWAMPTWCHMFNSTLTGNARVWFDKLPKESIDSYEDLRAAFRENYRQQTKHIKDPVEIHHIKQRDGESMKDFMERYKEEVLDVEGAPECMKISEFMHGITHPELIKRLYEKIPRLMDEMYRVTTSFLQGEVAVFSHGRKKAPTPWKQPEGGNKPSFKKGFKNKHRSDRKPDRFSLLTKTPKEIFTLEKGKFKTPPPMVTPAEKRDPNKYCEFHADTGHSTDECMQLRKQIDEMIKAVAKQKVTQSFSPETTISFPPLGDEDGTEGPMIIEAEIGGHFVHRMYVDEGASSEILYEHCFVRLRPEIRSQMVSPTTYLTGFSGETIWPLGQISLLVKIGDEGHSTSAWMNFIVVRSPSQHNGIIGRSGIRKIRAIPSTAHGMLKFPVEGGTVTLRSRRIIQMECAMISGPSTRPPDVGKILEEKIRVSIHPEYPEQTIAIGSTLTEKGRKELCTLLGQNLDVFAWKPADMTGVPRHIAEHRLNEEVEKLVDAGIMKEVHYHNWVSNPVMVKKNDRSWRMCVDFKDLNKACPHDGYPLPEIDWKVESLCGYPFKCFLDAYKGYHQIKMAKEDEEKMAFITNQGIFCYSKMSFGLKKCRSDLSAFGRQGIPKTDQAQPGGIGRRLGHKKPHGRRNYLRHSRNIQNSPTNKHEAESKKILLRNARGDVLGLQRRAKAEWETSKFKQEAEAAFKQMKKLIAELSMLTAPKEKEELIIYLVAAKEAISAVLMTEREGKQIPIYFVSRALRGPEINYNPMEKLVLALLSASRRLKGYFQAYAIIVITDQPIKQLLPRASIKGQILADFIVERPEEESPDVPMTEPEEIPKPWTLFTDGSSCIDGFGAGLILTNPEGVEFTYVMRFRFEATNNEAEYEALIAGLRIAEQMGVKNLQANVDSWLVDNQVNGSYVAKESGMVQYLEKVKWLTSNFKEFSIKQVPRSKNKKADALSKIASTSFVHLRSGYQQKDRKPSQNDKTGKRAHKQLQGIYHPSKFGLPREIVSDNGKQFFENPFKDCCEKLSIRQCFAFVKHPQTNGLVERANKSLGEGIKARLDERSKDWMGELSHVLWAHRTMIKSSNGETPFSLTYGTEAVIPAEIGMPTLWTAEIDLIKNDEALEINLDLIEEKREQAAIQEAKSKAKMEKYYNSKIHGTSFKPRNMVYRNNDASHAKDGGKLGPKWEGPYKVT